MRQLKAFIRKELLGQYRSGKLFILGAVFLFFGIMSPALAKLTPKLMELLAEDSGIVYDNSRVITAVDAFDQFFKNISTCLIVFVIMQAGIFTKEYSTGTLLLSLTKGMKRSRVVAAKAIVLCLLWTLCYFLCFGVCAGYTAYFWDISAVKQLMTAVICWWVYGLFYISVTVFFSSLVYSAAAVIACTAGVFFGMSIALSVIPKVREYIPAQLSNAAELTHGKELDIAGALAVTAVISLLLIIVSVPLFNKKQL